MNTLQKCIHLVITQEEGDEILSHGEGVSQAFMFMEYLYDEEYGKVPQVAHKYIWDMLEYRAEQNGWEEDIELMENT